MKGYTIVLNILVMFYCINRWALGQVIQEETNYHQIKCLVCEQIMKEIHTNISKVNPDIKVKVGSFRLDDTNANKKTVEYRKSESYLTELLENFCEKMDDFVKVKHRNTGKISVIPIMLENGIMNPLMSEVDVVQDENLNKSLKLYCEEIMEDYDEKIVEHIQNDFGNNSFGTIVCKTVCDKFTKNSKDEL